MPGTVFVEAEGFGRLGGWVVDQQFMDQMGSPYLLAHGMGVPVEDARTTVEIPEAGEYRVWVRTKDWVAPWGAPGAPGRFQVLVNGSALEATFGTEGAEWHWQDGGTVRLAKGKVEVALHDLTGFEGRCEAVLFAKDARLVPPEGRGELEAFRRRARGLPEGPEDAGEFDLVVVGGGIAGACAALSAARLGLAVALVQDRPVLGGNNSSEVRVWLGGETGLEPYPRVGDVVRELEPARRAHYGPGNRGELYEDAKREGLVGGEKGVTLLLWHRANAVEAERGRIRAVVAEDVRTGLRKRLRGRLYADCTGDGAVGFLAGAEHEMTLKGHMGPSNLWHVVDTGAPSPFPRCPWALDLSDKPFPGRAEATAQWSKRGLESLGSWFWESGFDLHPIEDAELIRDWNLRAMYGAWDTLKNVDNLYPNHELRWSAFVAGKRESRRLLGDVILAKADLLSGREFEDACVPCTWGIDVHVPHEKYRKGFEGREFISRAIIEDYKRPYWMPYRCLYSANVPNLFMAGRDVSVTHEALGTVRVMRTCGMMGEVVGMAASICVERDCDPRDVYRRHLAELKGLMRRGVGPDAGAGGPDDAPEIAGTNVAPSAEVTVSGSYDEAKFPKGMLTDGRADARDNSSRWLSDAKLPHVVELAWPEAKVLAAARVVTGYREGGGVTSPVRDFALQYESANGWADIPGAAARGNSLADWRATFEPVRTSRVRLVVTATPGDISRIWEIGLYGPPPGAR